MLSFLKRKSRTRRAARVPDSTRVYAIGDIHGCLDLLDRLHEQIEADWAAEPLGEAHLIYLGDFIDRGPDSFGVLERLCREPLPGFRRTLIGGNHEELLLAFLENPAVGDAWYQIGGLETLFSYGIPLKTGSSNIDSNSLAATLSMRLPPEHLMLLRSLVSSARIGDYFFCHAGVKPGVPLDAQSDRDLRWIREEFLQSGEDFGAVVVHGHTPVQAPHVLPNRINVDTGAYLSGQLTCLVLEGEQRRFLKAERRFSRSSFRPPGPPPEPAKEQLGKHAE